MATNYPGSLDTSSEQPSPSASTEMDDAGFEHDVVHTNHSGAIIALETKVGTGSSTAAANSVLAGTGSGTSGWSTAPSLAGLTVDTDTLHVDATNDRVGIGTTSPDSTLHVNGTIDANGTLNLKQSNASSSVNLMDTLDGTFWHLSGPRTNNDNLNLYWYNGSSYALNTAFTDDGKVGIGTETPPGHLQVASQNRAVSVLDSGDNNYAELGFTSLSSDSPSYGYLSGYGIFFRTGTSRSGLANRMYIEPGGNVGIGTTSPDQRLHVNSGNTNTTAVFESNDGTAIIGIKDSATSGNIYVGVAALGNDLRLRAGNAYRMTIESGGDVGIGTTNPAYLLDVNGDSRFSDRMIIRASGSDILTLEDSGGTDEGGYINFANSSGTSMGYMGFGNNDDIHIRNTNSGGNIYIGVATRWAAQIDTSGNFLPYSDNVHSLGASGRAWNHFYLHQGNTFSSGGYWTLRSRDSDRQIMEYTSSERFKKDIVDLPTEEAYQILDARPIKFRGIDDDDDTPLEAGLSAESLHEAGFEYAVRYDEGHWGETPRSVYYEMLTAPLIKICKDLHDRVTALEAA